LPATKWATPIQGTCTSPRAHVESRELRAGLVAQLTNGKETKLAGTKRLIVWERITSGEILFEGMGREIDDDVFRVAGRANWVFFD
tara:strand:+ start:3363 stop:3620 length:258 start_codon:yes stop_codon:yes gene_type:complete